MKKFFAALVVLVSMFTMVVALAETIPLDKVTSCFTVMEPTLELVRYDEDYIEVILANDHGLIVPIQDGDVVDYDALFQLGIGASGFFSNQDYLITVEGADGYAKTLVNPGFEAVTKVVPAANDSNYCVVAIGDRSILVEVTYDTEGTQYVSDYQLKFALYSVGFDYYLYR